MLLMKTVRQEVSSSFVIKKSEFIGIMLPVGSMDEVKVRIEQEWNVHSDARHIAWAAKVGNRVRMQDDGEPSGTAGMPILNVLQHQDIDQVLLMVVRYFGGVKLGAGGLTRAYSQAASMVVQQAEYIEFIPIVKYRISADYAREKDIRHMIETFEAIIAETSYDLKWQVLVEVKLIEHEKFAGALINLCQGQVELKLEE